MGRGKMCSLSKEHGNRSSTRGQPMSHTPHCTCRVAQTKTIVSRPLTSGDFTREWGPRHAAALELLAALKEAGRYVKSRQNGNQNWPHQLADVIEAAIAHAESQP